MQTLKGACCARYHPQVRLSARLHGADAQRGEADCAQPAGGGDVERLFAGPCAVAAQQPGFDRLCKQGSKQRGGSAEAQLQVTAACNAMTRDPGQQCAAVERCGTLQLTWGRGWGRVAWRIGRLEGSAQLVRERVLIRHCDLLWLVATQPRRRRL